MELLSQLGPVQRHAGGLHALYVRMEPGAAMHGHRHDDPTIVIIVRGAVDVTENNVTVHETAGTLRLSATGVSRDVESPKGADCLVVSCDPAHAIARHAIWATAATDSVRFSSVNADAFVEHVSNPGASLQEFETLCVSILTDLNHNTDSRHRAPTWLKDALHALSQSGGQSGAGNEVARSIGVHPVHLGRIVRRFTGLTMREYLRRERILRGSQLMRASQASLTRVAHEAGFADQSHFSREFSRRYGHSPSDDQFMTMPDVVSVQASDFPAVHLGSRIPTRKTGDGRKESARRAELDNQCSSNSPRGHSQ